mmetsp:Transcript_16121/g.52032  ORF Transcript_16121/g.52032 Transcript_16121/m.52032 type:complete len:95 (+) Transcript_16121:3-287(+)
MQQAGPHGLEPAPEEKRRCSVTPIHHASEVMASELVRMWAHRSIGEARELLASPDVTVTNQADKELQLLKLLELDSLVSEAFASCAEAERKGGA